MLDLIYAWPELFGALIALSVFLIIRIALSVFLIIRITRRIHWENNKADSLGNTRMERGPRD